MAQPIYDPVVRLRREIFRIFGDWLKGQRVARKPPPIASLVEQIERLIADYGDEKAHDAYSQALIENDND